MAGRGQPKLALQRVAQLNGEIPGCLAWSPNGSELACGCGATVLLVDPKTGNQRHLIGHTDRVTAVRYTPDGSALATAQEGDAGGARIWDCGSARCKAVVGAKEADITSLDVSADGSALLVACRARNKAKRALIVYDLEAALRGYPAAECARKETDQDVRVVAFSPSSGAGKMLAAGRGTLRVYRGGAGEGELRGRSVNLGKLWRVQFPDGDEGPKQCFTSISFEKPGRLAPRRSSRALVGSASGEVFLVDCAKASLVRCLRLHARPVNHLTATAAFLATASDDSLVRLWPPGLQPEEGFLLEAEHSARPTAVAPSPDGLRLATASDDGSLGCLDIPSHGYVRLGTSHSGRINALAMAEQGNLVASASRDGSIRCWSAPALDQQFEQCAPGDEPISIAMSPGSEFVAAGFSSGSLRVYKVPSGDLVTERRQHRHGCATVAFLGETLVSAGDDGLVCAYDGSAFEPSRYLATGLPKGLVAPSPDGALLACASLAGARCLDVHGKTLLKASARLPGNSSSTSLPCAMAFSPCSSWLLLASPRSEEVHCFRVGEFHHVASFRPPHSAPLRALAAPFSGSMEPLTGGPEGSLAVGSGESERYEHCIFHHGGVTSVCCSASAGFALSGDDLGGLALWSLIRSSS